VTCFKAKFKHYITNERKKQMTNPSLGQIIRLLIPFQDYLNLGQERELKLILERERERSLLCGLGNGD
jgi:hypothetical protein